MNARDALSGIADFWREFRRDRSGLVGLGIFVVAILAIALEGVLTPFPEASRRWRDIGYWEDNPPAAPPAWTNVFRREKKAVAEVIPTARVSSGEENSVVSIRYELDYRFDFDGPPRDLVFKCTGRGTFPLLIGLRRPDGDFVELYQKVAEDMDGEELRISIGSDCRDGAFDYLRSKASPEALAGLQEGALVASTLLFSEAGPEMAVERKPLKGVYTLVARTFLTEEGCGLESARLVVVGSVSGILGTDTAKRDIFSGAIAGLKWALLIGILTSAVSVLVGVAYGVISAYFGGSVDAAMNFVFEFFVSMPVLPILIVVSAVFKPSIWTLVGALIVFSWVGPVKTVRSMALQIKEETYIEAARALGSGHWRIIFRHMMPILIPYSFATMALAVPGAIIYEASVSLLGLGDASMVTWGQILFDAVGGGAVLNGLWWWVVPPGLLIAVMGMTFAFLGFAMDKILHPKLRTR